MTFLDRKQFVVDLLGDVDMMATALRVGSVELEPATRYDLGQAAVALAAACLADLDRETLTP